VVEEVEEEVEVEAAGQAVRRHPRLVITRLVIPRIVITRLVVRTVQRDRGAQFAVASPQFGVEHVEPATHRPAGRHCDIHPFQRTCTDIEITQPDKQRIHIYDNGFRSDAGVLHSSHETDSSDVKSSPPETT
jgi:hypothetical protein